MAVKVRHPNVETQIGIDFIIMKYIANLVDLTPGLEWLKLSETMSQFSATIASQTDLGIEGKHLYLFNHHFKKWYNKVSFPIPIILTDSILVESFEYGDTVDKYIKKVSCKKTNDENNIYNIDKNINNNESNDGNQNNIFKRLKISKKNFFAELEQVSEECEVAHFIVTTGIDTYLKMLLQDNLMHADLHPGNILIQQSIQAKVAEKGQGKMGGIVNNALKIIKIMLTHNEDSENNDKNANKSNNNDKNNIYNNNSHDDNENQTLIIPKKMDVLINKIVLVDAGMVARLVPEERKNFIGLLEAMGEVRHSCVCFFSQLLIPSYIILYLLFLCSFFFN